VRWLPLDDLARLAPKLALLLNAIPPGAEQPIYLGRGEGPTAAAT